MIQETFQPIIHLYGCRTMGITAEEKKMDIIIEKIREQQATAAGRNR
jgi:hypothetical protein